MSTQIDERVVAMKFDNRDFKKNIGETMTLLDRFKAALNFGGAEKGIKEVERAASDVKLDGLTKAASAVEVKFTAMSIASIAAINRIVTAAMDAGTRLVKSLSIDQVTAGFGKYEEKLMAMRTIMNATGKTVDEVNTSLEKLQWFTDETSYNFTDMANNIGKFTSSAVDLDVAVTAMQGIANWAAVSGQGVNEASRAMYNLSQALSTGSVRLMDWMSIENANMGTMEFKQTVLDTAAAMGTLTKVGEKYFVTMDGKMSKTEVSAKNFRDTLKDEWFTAEVLLEVLEKYGEYADEIFKITQAEGVTAAEAMEMLGDTSMVLGQKAFQAAQEYKTFTDAINATKDAVSSGWMQTFEILFGNVEEAKELWSALGDELYRIFAENAEQRNEMLQEWKSGGGRDALLETFAKAWQNLLKIIEPVRLALRDLFPKTTATALLNFTKGLQALTDKFQLSLEASYTLHVAIKALLTPFAILFEYMKAGAIIVAMLAAKGFELANSFLAAWVTGNPLKDLIVGIFGEDRYNRMAEAMATIIGKIADAFDNVKDAIKKFAKERDLVGKFKEIIDKLAEALKPLGDWLLDKVVEGIEALANADYSNIGDFVYNVLDGMADKLEAIAGHLGSAKVSFDGFTSGIVSSAFGKFAVGIQDGWVQLKALNTTLKSTLALDKLFAGIKNQGQAVVDVVGELGAAFGRLVERLDPAKILVFAFGTSIVGLFTQVLSLTASLKKFVDAGTGVLTSTKGILDAFSARIKPNKVQQITNSILLLAGALIALALVPSDRLMAAAKALTMVGGGLLVFSAAMGVLNKLGLMNPEAMKDLGDALIKMGASVAILSGALVILSAVDLDGIMGKIGALGLVMAELIAMSVVMSIFNPSTNKTATQILKLSLSLLLVGAALRELLGIDWTGIGAAVSALGVVLLEISVVMLASSKASNKVGSQTLAMVVSIYAMVKVLEALATLNTTKIIKGLPNFILIMSTLSLLFLSTRLAGDNAQKAGIGILALSAGLILIGEAIKSIGELDKDTVIKGTASVAALIAMFSLLTGLSALAGEHANKMASNFVAIGVAMVFLGISIGYIGGLETAQVVKGTAAISVLLGFFALLMKVGTVAKDTKSPTGPIMAISVAIGFIAASLATLSLIKWQDLAGAVAALSITFVGLGVALSQMKKMDLKSAFASAVLIGTLLGALVASFKILEGTDGSDMVKQAVSIAGLLGAFGVIAYAMKQAKFEKNDVKSIRIATASIVGLMAVASVLLVAAASIQTLIGESGVASGTAFADTLLGMVPLLAAYGLLAKGAQELGKGADAFTDTKEGLKSVTAVMGIIGGILLAIGGLDILFDGGVLLAAQTAIPIMDALVSMSPHIVAFGILTLAAQQLGKGSNSVKSAASGAAAVDAVLFLVGGLLTAIGAADNKLKGGLLLGALAAIPIMDAIVSMSPHIAMLGLLTAAAQILGSGGGASIGAAASGGGAFAVVTGIIFAVTEVLGYLIGMKVGSFSLEEGLDKGIEVIKKIGDLIGTFIGNLVGGFIGGALDGVTKGLGNAAANLTEFASNITGFIVLFANGGINAGAVANAAMMADMLNILFGIEVKDVNLKKVGEQLTNFGPYVKAFGDQIADIEGLNFRAITDGVANIVSVFDKITAVEEVSQKGFTNFSFAVGILGTSIKAFAIQTKNIKIEELTAGVDAAAKLASIYDVLPQYEGLIQGIFGHAADMGDFADGVGKLGEALVSYNTAITADDGLDSAAINNSAEAAKGLAEVATALPLTGGAFQWLFGETTGLDVFSENIVLLAGGLVRFSRIVTGFGTEGGGVDVGAVTAAGNAAGVLSQLYDNLPSSGGVIAEWFFGENIGLAQFGTDLETLGSGIVSFCTAINGGDHPITEADATAAYNVASVLMKLNEGLPEEAGTIEKFFFGDTMNLTTFGEHLKSFGQAIADFVGAIAGVEDFERVSVAAEAAKKIAELTQSLAGISAVGVTQFKLVMTNLATGGIDSFVAEFEGSDEKVSNAVNEFIASFRTAIVAKGASTNALGILWCRNIFDGFKTEEAKTNIDNAADSVVAKFNGGVRSYTNIKAANLTGRMLVQGFINGMNEKKDAVTSAGETIGQAAIDGAKSALDEHSPSIEFHKIGEFAVDGLVNALEEDYLRVNETGKQIGEELVEGTYNGLTEGEYSKLRAMGKQMIDDFSDGGIEALPDAVKDAIGYTERITQAMEDSLKDRPKLLGQFVMMELADGITKDMTAEEAAQKKAENIISAFEDIFSAMELKFNRENEQYELWDAMNESATEEEKTQQKINRLMDEANQLGEESAIIDANIKMLQDQGVLTEQKHNELLYEKEQIYTQIAEKLRDIKMLQNPDEEDKYWEEEDFIAPNSKEMFKKAADSWNEQAGQEFKRIQMQSGMTEQEAFDAWFKYVGYDKDWKPPEGPNYNVTNEEIERFLDGEYAVSVDKLGTVIKEEVEDKTSKGIKSGLSSSQSMAAASDYGSNLGKTIGGSAGTEAIKSMTDALTGETDIYEQFRDTGLGQFENMLDGWKAGATEYASKGVQSFGEWLGIDLNKGFEKAEEIHSPSKVWYRYAGNIIDGLVLGLQDGKGKLVEAVSAMTSFMHSDEDQSDNYLAMALIKSLVEGVSTMTTEIHEGIATAMRKALEIAVEEIKPDYFEAGKTVGEQLNEGIVQAVKDGRASAIQEIVNTAVEAYQKAVAALSKGNTGPEAAGGGAEFFKAANVFDPTREKAALNNIFDGLAMALDRNDTEAARAWVARGYNEGRLQQILDLDDLPPQYAAYGERMMKLISEGSYNSAQKAASSSGGKRGKGGSGGSSKNETNNYFTQNNYSPKAISKADVYRQTKSLIGAAKNASNSKGGTRK